MGMVRMPKNDGKKTMKTIERQVESAKTMETRQDPWRVDTTQDSAALHPRHTRETSTFASLYLRVRSTRKCEDPEETTADAPDRRKTTAKNETELQIEAPIKGTTEKREGWLRKTGESIISAIGLRKRGIFPFIKRDRRLQRRQVVSSKGGSICDPNEEGNVREPNEFLSERTKTPMGFRRHLTSSQRVFMVHRISGTRGQLRATID